MKYFFVMMSTVIMFFGIYILLHNVEVINDMDTKTDIDDFIKINELDNSSVKRLESSTSWLITEATGRLYKDPSYSKSLLRELIKKYLISMYNSPKILNKDYEITRYILKSRGIYYDISLLIDFRYMGEVYEYWVVNISSKKWATRQLNECHFIITKSLNKESKRVMIKDERQFFHSFEVNGSDIFNLDYQDDLKLRYKLIPSYYSGCYTQYQSIVQEEVRMNQHGNYYTIFKGL